MLAWSVASIRGWLDQVSHSEHRNRRTLSVLTRGPPFNGWSQTMQHGSAPEAMRLEAKVAALIPRGRSIVPYSTRWYLRRGRSILPGAGAGVPVSSRRFDRIDPTPKPQPSTPSSVKLASFRQNPKTLRSCRQAPVCPPVSPAKPAVKPAPRRPSQIATQSRGPQIFSPPIFHRRQGFYLRMGGL
jgi:hypothetical protein